MPGNPNDSVPPAAASGAMTRLIPLALVAAAVLSSGLGTGARADDGAPCGGAETRPWAKLSRSPSNAEALRRLADAHPYYPGVRYDREVWFSSPSGEVVLCRKGPRRFCSQEWWRFDQSGAGPVLSAQSGTLCVPSG